MTSSLLLQLRGLSKTYQRQGQEVQALRGMDLDLRPGEVLGLLGPNGSGKTTLIKLITALCEPTAGERRWRSEPIAGKDFLRHLGVLLEGRGALNERLTTWENARYFCGLREAKFESAHFERLAAVLEIADPHSPVRMLSTGNKLRSALLLTLIHKPALVLLDEPTLGLDLFGVEKLEALVRFAASQGTSFIVTSHDLPFIERLCPRIVCLRAGAKVFDGDKHEFLRLEYLYQVKLRPGPDCQLPQPWAWRQDEAEGGLCRLELRDHAQLCELLAQLQDQLPRLTELQVRPISLRDKYLQLVGAETQA